jgi:outer membrane protein
MKNALLALNALLTIAVLFLLVKHFQQPSSASGSTPIAEQRERADDADGLNVVYVQADSLINQYTSFNEKLDAMEKKEQEAEASLTSRGRALEKEFQEAGEKVQRGILTPNQIAELEQQLGKKQQSLMADQERLSNQLLRERQALQTELELTVKAILSQVRDEFGYDYILSYGPGTGVLMVNPNYDITAEVVKRLNADAELGKKKKED